MDAGGSLSLGDFNVGTIEGIDFLSHHSLHSAQDGVGQKRAAIDDANDYSPGGDEEQNAKRRLLSSANFWATGDSKMLMPDADNDFVLEWAYSVNGCLEEQPKPHGGASLRDPFGASLLDLGKQDKQENVVKGEAGEADEIPEVECLDDDEEEYLPVRPAGGRRERAAVREAAALKETENDERAKKKCTWRKYGQKVLKGKEFVGMDVIRCYYRCNVQGCKVKKQVEKASWQSNAEANVTVTGIHTHVVDPKVTDNSDIEEDETSGTGDAPTAKTRSHEPIPVPPLDTNFSNLVRDASPHFVISDPSREDCPILFVSPGFCELTGYSLTECVGRNCRFLQGKDTNPNAVRQISLACEAEKEIRVIVLNYKKDGTPFWNLLHVTPVKSSDGDVVSFVGVQLDVSAKIPV